MGQCCLNGPVNSLHWSVPTDHTCSFRYPAPKGIPRALCYFITFINGVTAASEGEGAPFIARISAPHVLSLMENPVDQASSETSDRSLDKVQRQVSDQLERELCQGELDEQDQSLCRQQTVSLNVSPNSVKHWDTAAAFRELFQNW